MTDEKPRLFLITPRLTGTAAERDALSAALSAGDVACVLARHTARDDRDAKTVLRDVVRLTQAAGAALLVEDDPRLAAHLNADGAQVAGPGDHLDDAIDSLKPERIVGCGGLSSRDDAMLAGEAEVDYLMFGEPDADDNSPDPAWVLERVRWWADIFNVPCVGVAQTLAEVGPLTQVRAEFIGLGDAVFGDPRGPAAAVADALAIIGAAMRVEPQ